MKDTDLPEASLKTGLHQTPIFHIKPWPWLAFNDILNKKKKDKMASDKIKADSPLANSNDNHFQQNLKRKSDLRNQPADPPTPRGSWHTTRTRTRFFLSGMYAEQTYVKWWVSWRAVNHESMFLVDSKTHSPRANTAQTQSSRTKTLHAIAIQMGGAK